MNLKVDINNLNYINYMKHKGNENGVLKRNMESERATIEEKQEEKEK